jgi:hypothetical protein
MAHPVMQAKGLMDEEYLQQLILDAVHKSNDAAYTTVHRCIEKTACTCIGVAVALCGCWFSTLGVKRTFFEKNKIKSGMALTFLGAAAVFVGLNITTINP